MNNAAELAKRIMADKKTVRIVGGASEILSGQKPRDIDLYTSESLSKIDTYLTDLLGNQYTRLISPYNIIQVFLITINGVQLIDILCGIKSLRIKTFYPRTKQIEEKNLVNFDHFISGLRVNSAIYYYKNITKTVLCNDHLRLSAKKNQLGLLEQRIAGFETGYQKIDISQNNLIRVYAFYRAIFEKFLNIYHTNISNIYFTDEDIAISLIKIADNNKDSLDFHVNCGAARKPYRTQRKILFLDLPISQMKVQLKKAGFGSGIYNIILARSQTLKIMNRIRVIYDKDFRFTR